MSGAGLVGGVARIHSSCSPAAVCDRCGLVGVSLGYTLGPYSPANAGLTGPNTLKKQQLVVRFLRFRFFFFIENLLAHELLFCDSQQAHLAVAR